MSTVAKLDITAAGAFRQWANALTDAALRQSAAKVVSGALPWKEADKMIREQWELGLRATAQVGVEDGAAALKLTDPASIIVENPFATEFAATRSATLVTDVSRRSKLAVRETIKRGFANGLSTEQVARMIRGYRKQDGTIVRGIIGLASRGAAARDRQFARLLADGLDFDQAMLQSSKYAKRLLIERGDLIARTEILTALNQGKVASWREAQSQGLLLPTARKRWITSWDERTCPICMPLHGVQVPLDKDFPGGVGSPPIHPDCRCSVNIVTMIPGSAIQFRRPSAAQVESKNEATREFQSMRAVQRRQWLAGEGPRTDPQEDLLNRARQRRS